jgi:hypothetical protein
VDRIVFIGWLVLLLFGCASRQAQEGNGPGPTGGNGPAPSVPPQQTPAAAPQSSPAPVPSAAAAEISPPTPIAATGKMEVLGEISDSTPGAASITPPPCNLDSCAIVLAIVTRKVAESVADDDGGPGVYVPEGMVSMETAGQPGIWDAYGVEKIIQVWVITVRSRNGAVQVIEQRNSPAFSVGDSVLVEGNTVQPWN